jgi:hypothetical protein
LRIRREIRENVFTPRYAALRGDFWHSGESEKIVSAFTETVKVTVYQKIRQR